MNFNNKNKSCFLSYPYGDYNYEKVFYASIIPALESAKWKIFDPRFDIMPGDSIHDSIYKFIKNSNLQIFELSQFNANVIYELGLAHAWGKRTILIAQNIDKVPFDIVNRYPVFVYSKSKKGLSVLRDKIQEYLYFLEIEEPSLKDPTLDRLVDYNVSVSIEFFAGNTASINSLVYLAQFVLLLNRIGDLEEASVKEFRIGSLGAWLSSNIDSVVSLVEKIIFIVPEWKRRSAEKVRIEAETELIFAQAERTRAEANEIMRDSDRKDALTLLELIEKTQNIGGVRITIGDQLQIDNTKKDQIVIGRPKKN